MHEYNPQALTAVALIVAAVAAAAVSHWAIEIIERWVPGVGVSARCVFHGVLGHPSQFRNPHEL